MPLRFSLDQVNRYLLHKQHLAPESKARDILSLVRDVGPIRGTPPATPYMALWARMARFRLEDLDAALYTRPTLVRMPAMRARLYILPAEKAPAYYQATRTFLQGGLRDLDLLLSEAMRNGKAPPLAKAASDGILGSVSWSEHVARRVLEVMSTRGPCTIAELSELLPELNARLYHDPDVPELGYSQLGTRLVPAMCAEGLLVHARPQGGWRSNVYNYAAWSSWLPHIDLSSITPAEGLDRLVEDYVRAYGPVTVGDLSHWLGGAHRQRIVSSLMRQAARMMHVQIAGLSGDYVMCQAQLDEMASLPEEEPFVCLLPSRDSYSMAYRDARRLVAEPYRERVFDRVGESQGTVWVCGYPPGGDGHEAGEAPRDACIAGTWRWHAKDERISVHFFEGVHPDVLADAGEAAYQLARCLGFASFDVDLSTGLDDEANASAVAVAGAVR